MFVELDMDGRTRKVLSVGVLIIALLIAGYVLAGHISPNNEGVRYDYEKAVKAFIVFLMSVTAIKLMFLTIIKPSEAQKNRKIPSILKYVFGALILFIAATFIVTNIYEQSALAIFATLGASGIGIAYIAQDFLKELLAGVVIAFQNNFRIGDWVKFPNGTIGKISKTQLSGMELSLLDGTVLYIANTTITGQSMVNLSQPTPELSARLDVVLEHSVPIDRARRILHAAISETKGLASKDALIVADSFTKGGVLFSIFFKIPSFETMCEMKHRVAASVARCLHKHDLKICESNGQYSVKEINAKTTERFDDFYVTDALSTLKFSGLLKNCDEDIQEKFAKNMRKLTFKSGETICEQDDTGDTMFIVAEGVVDVSIKVVVKSEDGTEQSSSKVVATLADGDYFGEMALLRGERRAATITAKSDVVLYEIRRETVHEFVEQYPDFAHKLSEAIVERNSENEEKVSETMDKLARKKTAASEFMTAFKAFLRG